MTAQRGAANGLVLPRLLLAAAGAGALAALLLFPRADLAVAGWFYLPGAGFPLAEHPFFIALHYAATYGARALGAALVIVAAMAALRRGPVLGLAAKAWLFLFLGLLIAPGLVGNVLLKDHWGRARPREVTEFGGPKTFSPPLAPQKDARRNGSFVAGDAAFGFYLASFAYVMPPPSPSRDKRRRRRYSSTIVFRAGLLAGVLFGLARIVMGAHFFSDVVFAAITMLITAAALHAAMFGRRATRARWREWLGLPDNQTGR